MKESSDFSGFDDSKTHEFDPHTDFTQFLEEARRCVDKKQVPEVKNQEKDEQLHPEKKQSKKKPWKLCALFSSWKVPKAEKKAKLNHKESSMESQPNNPNRNKHRTHNSGPVRVAGPGGKRHRRPASGPLTNLLHSKQREEMREIPYVSLNKLTKPQYDAKVYGPIYLVS